MPPEKLELITKLAGPVATVLASLTAAIVAIIFGVVQARNGRRQTKIASDKLAVDLFDRRIKAFESIREPIGEIVRSGASSSHVERSLLGGIEAARFLFGQEVKDYLDVLYKHLIDLDLCNTMLNGPTLSQQDRAKYAQARTNHFQAITSFYGKIDDLFGPYLFATHKFTER